MNCSSLADYICLIVRPTGPSLARVWNFQIDVLSASEDRTWCFEATVGGSAHGIHSRPSKVWVEDYLEIAVSKSYPRKEEGNKGWSNGPIPKRALDHECESRVHYTWVLWSSGLIKFAGEIRLWGMMGILAKGDWAPLIWNAGVPHTSELINRAWWKPTELGVKEEKKRAIMYVREPDGHSPNKMSMNEYNVVER